MVDISFIYSEFISKLELLYGSFNRERKSFEKASNSTISRDLGYSDAQFSRLVNESATEGEYQRANQNADRILQIIKYEAQLKELSKRSPKKNALVRMFLLLLTGIVIGFAASMLMGDSSDANSARSASDGSKYDMLRWSFETPFVNPYTKLRSLPADCDFPCYKYQGKWELKEGYKLPFLKERSGFHYSAVSAVMYARCNDVDNDEGKKLEGFEYQLHEIWYDQRELPIDSFTMSSGQPKEFYKKLDFSKDDNFVKIATIHTFYSDQFVIDSLQIHRSGKDIARDVEFISNSELSKIINDKKVMNDLEGEISLITTNPLLEFSQPSECKSAPAPNVDFHMVREGDQMTFDCQMTTSRAVISYTKSFQLVDQYINEVCRPTRNAN
ncbi:MAG: hypothetical protein RLN86_00255 [Cyclobacteriaceae bacterium]